MKRSARFLEAMEAYRNNRVDLAMRLMQECAGDGDPVACYMVALWYREGEGAPIDPVRSEKWMARLEELAEQGNAEAQWDLGQYYRFGDLVRLDVKQANFWLERAAESGYGEAQHHLAWYLETGQYDYPIDTEASAMWYKRAFEQEHPETLYLFAIKQFREGQPTEEAIRLLRKAADKGFTRAEDVLRSYTH